METVPYVISADLHSAQLFRQTLQNLLSGSGVVGSTDLEVTQETVANMSVNIGAGYVMIPGTQGSTTGQRANAGSQHTTYSSMLANFTTQGIYNAVNPAKVNLTLEAANATNPRIDLIVASVQDAEYSGSFNQALLQVVTGTPAGSPSPPTPPENTVVLAQVEVKAKATEIKTASITNERPVATYIPKGFALVETENSYSPRTERVVGTEYEPSSTRMTCVVVDITGATTEGAMEAQFYVGGELVAEVFQAALPEKNAGQNAAVRLSTSFIVPPGQKWKATTNALAGSLHSSYLFF
jgi:hypothetical protein